MPESNLPLASKVIITESDPVFRDIPDVPTSISAYVGIFERGPMNTPTLVTGFNEAKQVFGEFIAESDALLHIGGFFQNGGTALWIVRVAHYTDITSAATLTATPGQQEIPDRGGIATPAVLDSLVGPFDLADGEVLEWDIDQAGAQSITFNAAPAEVDSQNSESFALVNGDTLRIRVQRPGSSLFEEIQEVVFQTADFVSIGAATAEEVAAVINRDTQFISATTKTAGTIVSIRSDKAGAGAQLEILADSTSIAAGKLNIASGINTGTGNVQDIDAVTATEIVSLITTLGLTTGLVAVTANDEVRFTSTATGITGEVEITNNTTALGIFSGSLPITQNGSDAGESPSIRLVAKTPGAYVENYQAIVSAASSGDSDRFNLAFRRIGATLNEEQWANLSMDENDARYVEEIVGNESRLFDVVDLFSPATDPNNLPKLGTFQTWTGQDDGLTGLADTDFIGSDASSTGLRALDSVQQLGTITVPGRETAAVHNALIDYCQTIRGGDCFPVMSSPAGLSATGLKSYVETTALLVGKSEFASLNWPRIEILNPNKLVFGNEDRLVVSPSAHIAGGYARRDAAQLGGVYTAFANQERGQIVGAVGLETDEAFDGLKLDIVYPLRVNPITSFQGGPIFVDGSRTLKGDGNFPSIPERRGVIFIEQSIKLGLQFAKHRNNDRRLRQSVKLSIEAFLLEQFRNEAFRGETPGESFFVDVSDNLNTPEVILANQLRVRVGLATQRPAEFIFVDFSQDTRAIEESIARQLGN